MSILRALAIAFCLPALAGSADAGAWPRKKGETFISAAARLSWPQDLATWTSREPTGQYYTLYAEYGLTGRITLGLDLGHSVSGGGKSVAFLRLPLRSRDSGLQIAAELGLGQIEGATVIRPGLSLGLGREAGWLSADGLAEISLGTGQTDLKLDLTYGLNLPKGRKLILQLQTGAPYGNAPFARLAPSIVLPVAGSFSVEAGVTWGVTGDSSMGVLLGMWSTF